MALVNGIGNAVVLQSRLTVLIVLFVLFDFGALALGFAISEHVKNGAVAINLAGRQRMLSQKITKASVLSVKVETDKKASDYAAEAASAYALFVNTLEAFRHGGSVAGGDGREVRLNRLTGKSLELASETAGLMSAYPSYPKTKEDQGKFAEFMVENNAKILVSMNDLTSALESDSLGTVSTLRAIQVAAFILSLLNFVGIVGLMSRDRASAALSAKTDALTGLLNRGGFYSSLGERLAYHGSRQEAVSVLLLDLDGFKEVNDRFGHASGDDILREASRRMSSWVKRGETVGRIGGDEFAIILNDDGSPLTAEKAASALSDVLCGMPCNGLLVSASVGFASSVMSDDVDSLLSRADESMYSAKKCRKEAQAKGGLDHRITRRPSSSAGRTEFRKFSRD